MISTDQITSIVVLVIGGLVFWANPRRSVNRAVFGASATVAAWAACKYFITLQPTRGLFWLRWVFAFGALAPLSLWTIKESIVGTFEVRRLVWLRRNIFWFVSTAIIALLPFSEFFIPYHSTEDNKIFGFGYSLYYIGIGALYLKLFWDSVTAIRNLTGAKRLELQIWLCGGCAVAVLIYALIALYGLTKDPIYRSLQPLAVLVFYAATAYAITSNRIFNARQIFLVSIEKLAVAVGATASALMLFQVLKPITSESAALIGTIPVAMAVSAVLSRWLDRKFHFVSHAGVARRQAFETAQQETRFESLMTSFTSLLKGWGQTEHAIILSGMKDKLSGGGLCIGPNSTAFQGLKALRWVTPERLSRERRTENSAALSAFLDEHQLGVLVLLEGPTTSVILGLGLGTSRRPYTYPHVTELLELGAIIQGALERAHFTAKAQQAEQLATVGLLGASVAHEIRNPLVSIKTFVQLLPTHHQDKNFRDKFFKLIGDEVARIDQLTEQLLDLASPRAYSAQLLELHALLSTSLNLVATKAAHRQIELITDFRASPDRAFTDASAAKQVLLNLCFNAIQAIENHQVAERWVRIETRNTSVGIEMAVADSGPGIAPEMRTRLFQPFQTTKSSGFGLGLAICSDILANVQASISVDPSEPGRGATFRVTFPCQPSSS